MESKDHSIETSNKHAPNINIDISGEPDDGDVKNMNLDANTAESRVGLSKDELMKYANQPFWIRLRNILFASFWIVWLSILVAAIGYVVHSPGCAKLVSAATANNSTIAASTTPAPGASSG